MDAITDPRYQRIVLMMGSQLGKTQIQLAVIGYFSHWDPAPILVIQASVDEAENFSKNRVAKMIETRRRSRLSSRRRGAATVGTLSTTRNFPAACS